MPGSLNRQRCTFVLLELCSHPQCGVVQWRAAPSAHGFTQRLPVNLLPASVSDRIAELS